MDDFEVEVESFLAETYLMMEPFGQFVSGIGKPSMLISLRKDPESIKFTHFMLTYPTILLLHNRCPYGQNPSMPIPQYRA